MGWAQADARSGSGWLHGCMEAHAGITRQGMLVSLEVVLAMIHNSSSSSLLPASPSLSYRPSTWPALREPVQVNKFVPGKNI